ncbi:MAG: DUF2807 domain-containing protein [Robiginitalea sp.]
MPGTLFFALLIACPGFGQRKPKIKGNRSVITVDKELSPFTKLILSEDLEVVLKPGGTERVRIEADDNLIDILRFEVEGSTLSISSFYTITSSKKLELILEYRQLENIHVETGRLIGEETLNTDQLRLSIVEDGKAHLNIRASLMELTMEGKASSELRVETDSLHATLEGSSDAFIYSSKGGIDISMTGQASLDLEGVAESLSVSLTDNAKLKASGMEAEEVRAFLNASANARVKAVSNLAFEGRGSARLFVYGQPGIQILGLYDSAELHKVPD